MKKYLKFAGIAAAALLVVGFLLLLVPEVTGSALWGSTHIVLNQPFNGFAATFGSSYTEGYVTYSVDALGVAITAFVFFLVSIALAAFIIVNNLLKKPLVKLEFPVFWSALFVTSLVTAILYFVAHGQLAQTGYDLGAAFILAAILALLTALLAGCRVVIKFLKKA